MFIILIILQLTSRQVNRVSNTWSPTKALAIANAKKIWWDYTGCTEVAVRRLLRIQKGLLIAQTCQETVCALALDLHTAWNPAFSISDIKCAPRRMHLDRARQLWLLCNLWACRADDLSTPLQKMAILLWASWFFEGCFFLQLQLLNLSPCSVFTFETLTRRPCRWQAVQRSVPTGVHWDAQIS